MEYQTQNTPSANKQGKGKQIRGREEKNNSSMKYEHLLGRQQKGAIGSVSAESDQSLQTAELSTAGKLCGHGSEEQTNTPKGVSAARLGTAVCCYLYLLSLACLP